MKKVVKFTTASGCPFVTDKSSKRRFLIDTGSDLCVFPRKLIPQRRTCVNYDLMANGTSIPTYRWLPLSLNLRLLRDLSWRLVVADVTQPLIRADFLSHFGLLVDGITSSFTPAQTTSPWIPIIKVISGGTLVDTLLYRVSRPHSSHWSSVGSAPQYHTPHLDCNRPTSHLSTMPTGT
jgi:hypothetical protein